MAYNKYLMKDKIERLKEISHMTNRQIAAYLGVSMRAVSDWEKGTPAHSDQADRLDRLIAMIEDETPFLVQQWLVDDVLI